MSRPTKYDLIIYENDAAVRILTNIPKAITPVCVRRLMPGNCQLYAPISQRDKVVARMLRTGGQILDYSALEKKDAFNTNI